MGSKASVDLQTLEVAQQIGQFIEYWGFKKIHGKVWSLVFLSEGTVNAEYLRNTLGVSKALISMTLTDLLKYEVVIEVNTVGGIKFYQSNNDLYEVVSNVLRQREAKMLMEIRSSCDLLQRYSAEQGDSARARRAGKLGEMVRTADELLSSCLNSKKMHMGILSKVMKVTLPKGISSDNFAKN